MTHPSAGDHDGVHSRVHWYPNTATPPVKGTSSASPAAGNSNHVKTLATKFGKW